MEFHAVEQKTLYLPLAFIMFIAYIVNYQYIFIIIALVCVTLMNVKYHLYIADQHMTFTASLLRIKLMKRTVTAANIRYITYNSSQNKNTIFIKLNKRMRWKLSRFQPDHFVDSIKTFAQQNAIQLKL